MVEEFINLIGAFQKQLQSSASVEIDEKDIITTDLLKGNRWKIKITRDKLVKFGS